MKTDTQGEHGIRTEAEIGVTQRQAKEDQDSRPPAHTGRSKQGFNPESPRGHDLAHACDLADSLMLDFWPPEP